MKILFHNASILTMKSPDIIKGDLVVLDKRVIYIGNDASSYAPFDRVIECEGNLIMPGFKNAHAHSAMVFLKNKANADNLQTWLFDIVFPREKCLQPEDIYHLNNLAYLEYIQGGITACYEHYFFPVESAKAAHDFGFRTLLLGTYDEKKLSVEQLVKTYHLFNDVKDDLVTYSVGFHAEYTSSENDVKETKRALDILKAPFYTHISETNKEVEECYQKHGVSPVKYLDQNGMFAYGGGGYHCIHFNDEDIAIFKKHNLSVVSCPGSNQFLNSGVAPLRRYLDEGLNVALGTDGPASNDDLSMFHEMKLAASLYPDIPSYDILKMATVNGAKAMHMLDADTLDIGKYADIIMLDVKSNDVISSIVEDCSNKNVLLTMINGIVLYEKGKFFLKESVEEIYNRANKIIERLELDVLNR